MYTAMRQIAFGGIVCVVFVTVFATTCEQILSANLYNHPSSAPTLEQMGCGCESVSQLSLTATSVGRTLITSQADDSFVDADVPILEDIVQHEHYREVDRVAALSPPQVSYSKDSYWFSVFAHAHL